MEDSTWKVQADVCVPVFLCPHPPFLYSLFLCFSVSQCILLINLLIFLSPFPQTLLPSVMWSCCSCLSHFPFFLCYSFYLFTLSFCLSVFLSGLLYSIFPSLFLLIPLLSHFHSLPHLSPFSFFLSIFLTLSSFLPGLNHRAWWPWERPGPGPQEQDLLQVRPPEEGGQRPAAPWRRRLTGGLEERCGLCRQGLRQGALSQWSLHRTSQPTL